MKKILRLAWLLTLLSVFALLPSSSYAQDYSFTLDGEVAEVWINGDGSIRLEYWFSFTCDSGARPIDVVDVGLPNGNYRLSDISADVDGRPVSRIDSDYQGEGSYGVAVWLGTSMILPGDSGTVHVVIPRISGMVYEDSEDANYASTEFSPTWFGSRYVHGTTVMTVKFHLPPGVQPDEPRWHRSPSGWPDAPQPSLDGERRVLYTWYNAAAAPDRQYTFGASFPRQYVDASAIQRGPSALEAAFAFMATAVTGCASVVCNPVTIFIILFIGLGMLGSVSQRQRKMQYLPPQMKIEGVGIKRGLMAVEAAILLETPLNKVLTMILFGLLKKGAVTVLSEDPLRVQANEPRPEGLRPYEVGFLDAIGKDGQLVEGKLRQMVIELIKTVNGKMKGFSRRESVAYYKDIVRRAWQQVTAGETPEVRSERFDQGLEWMMLDENFEQQTQGLFQRGPVYMPPWWIYYRPWGRPATVAAGPGVAAPAPSMPAGRVQLPTLPGSEFAARIVRGVEGTAGKIVRNVTGFTGAVTEVTNPLPKPSTSSGRYRSGGGGGCACACACAGCACACAGGGR